MLLPNELALLKTLEKKYVLLPVGADHPFSIVKKKKAPVNPNGGLLKGWNSPEQKGLTIQELWNYRSAIAIGLRLDNLFVLDFDGESAVKEAKRLGLVGGEPTWEIKRTGCEGYYKRIFAPTKEQLNCIPPNSKNKKEISFPIYTKEEKDSREAIEFFGNTLGRQVIISGSHYSSGGRYYWEEGSRPENLRPPTVREWNKILRLTKKYVEEKVPPGGLVLKNKTGWSRMSECEICGRTQRVVCSITEDKNTISCFHGITYRPPLNLHKGEVIKGTWAFSKIEDKSFGRFSYFVRHKPNPQELLQRRLQNIV